MDKLGEIQRRLSDEEMGSVKTQKDIDELVKLFTRDEQMMQNNYDAMKQDDNNQWNAIRRVDERMRAIYQDFYKILDVDKDRQ